MAMYILQRDKTGAAIHIEGQVHTTDRPDTEKALAVLYIFPGFLGLESLQSDCVSLVQDAKSKSAGASNPLWVSSNTSGTEPVLRLEFQPDDSFRVSSTEFAFHISEPAKVDVRPSPVDEPKAVAESDQSDSASSAVDAPEQDGEANVNPVELLIRRSMTEISKTKTKSHPFRNLEEQILNDSSHDAAITEDRVLDTPALRTRYVDPETIQDGLSEIDASAPNMIVSGFDPTRSQSPQSPVDGQQADVPETEAVPMNDPPSILKSPQEEVMTPTHSASGEKYGAKGDTPEPEADTPSAELAIEAVGPAAHPSSRKRKRPTTYTTQARSSNRKKAKVEQTHLKERGDNTKAGPATESIVITPSLGGKNAQRTPNTASTKASEASGSSKKTKRTTRSSEERPRPYEGPNPRVAFSNSVIPTQSKFMNFLKKQHAKKVDVVSDTTDILCVGDGELKRTSKLTLGVALGKHIVTDKWVTDSFQAGHLLDPSAYLPDDRDHEEEWRFKLGAAIERGRQGVKALQDWTVHITPTLSHELPDNVLAELKQMARTAGAKIISSGAASSRLPRQSPEHTPQTLVVGSEHDGNNDDDDDDDDDNDASALAKLGWTLYSKDIIALSILRGRLEVDSEEFKIHHHHTATTTSGGGGSGGAGKEKRGGGGGGRSTK